MTDDDLAYITPIASRIAKRMEGKWRHVAGLDLEDLEQEILCAALEAERTFDPARSRDLRGHLIKTMHRRTIDHCRRLDTVTHPWRALVAQVLAAQESLTIELGGNVTVEEAAELLGVEVARWRHIDAAIHSRNALRLDAPTEGEGGELGSVADTIADHEADPLEPTPAIDALHANCSRHERGILAARIAGERYEQIAAAWGITPREAQATHGAAVKRLREVLEAS